MSFLPENESPFTNEPALHGTTTTNKAAHPITADEVREQRLRGVGSFVVAGAIYLISLAGPWATTPKARVVLAIYQHLVAFTPLLVGSGSIMLLMPRFSLLHMGVNSSGRPKTGIGWAILIGLLMLCVAFLLLRR